MTLVAAHPICIGTRGSALALVQAEIVARALREGGAEVRIEAVMTDGDRGGPDTAWGEGAFVTAIETALLDGLVDIAVHSAKDVPTEEDPRLAIAAFLPREAAVDVLVLPEGRRIRSLDELDVGSRVGTDSPRRTAFLRALRPDLRLHPIHGNVDTRLRRLDTGDTDALVLAAAGLRRLGREDRISLVLAPSLVPPAPGQGALAVQVRASDTVTAALLGRLDHAATRRAVEAERALLAASGGGCRAPLGALATVVDGSLEMDAGFASPDGRIAVHVRQHAEHGEDPDVVARTLVELGERAAAAAVALGDPRVVVTGTPAGGAAMMLALVDRGLAPVAVPCIATLVSPSDRVAADDVLERLSSATWVVVTSSAAVGALGAAAERTGRKLSAPGLQWAAVGGATARALRAVGVTVSFTPVGATGNTLAETLPIMAGDVVLLPRGDLADTSVPDRLRERGAIVHPIVVYRTIEGPDTSRDQLRGVLANPPRAVVMTSASTVRGWLTLAAREDLSAIARATPIVAIGPSTAAEARRHDLTVVAEAAKPDPAAIADATADAVRALEETR